MHQDKAPRPTNIVAMREIKPIPFEHHAKYLYIDLYTCM